MEMNMMIRDLEWLFLIFWIPVPGDGAPDTILESFHVFDDKVRLDFDDVGEAKEQLGRFMEEGERHFQTDVYDASRQELGILKEEQILYIGEFYNSVRLVSEVLNNKFESPRELSNDEFKELANDSYILDAVQRCIDERKRASDAIGVDTVTIHDPPHEVYEIKSENWNWFKKIVYRIGGYW